MANTYPEVIIPPWVKPVSGTEPRLIDDQGVTFSPRFARGTSQRQVWGDPLWGFKLRFEAMRSADRAALRRVMLEARGKAANIRYTPGLVQRGSFTAPEVLLNNEFSSGTTSWGAGAGWALTVADQVIRSTRSSNTGAGNPLVVQNPVTLVAYAPYVLRYVLNYSEGVIPGGHQPTYSGLTSFGSSVTREGYTSGAYVSSTTTSVSPGIAIFDTTNTTGSYFEVPWISLSRCALVDNGVNGLLYSDALGQAGTWFNNNTAVSSNAVAAPDGTTTADGIVEDAVVTAHYISSSTTVSSAAGDYTLSISLKAGARTWARLSLTDFTAGNSCDVYVNLSTGATGTTVTGASWTGFRYHVESQGNGWWRVTATARKTAASTSVGIILVAANGDNSTSYAGNAVAVGIYGWRASLSQNSVPGRGAQTTSAQVTGTAQTGGQLYLKGLPASTAGLLLAGDFVEIGGELKQVTATLNSNEAGLGLLKFRPGLAISPADNDPVVINNPMGRFTLASDPRIVENYGTYTDVEIELSETYS